jgi:hypothetical protein
MLSKTLKASTYDFAKYKIFSYFIDCRQIAEVASCRAFYRDYSNSRGKSKWEGVPTCIQHRDSLSHRSPIKRVEKVGQSKTKYAEVLYVDKAKPAL